MSPFITAYVVGALISSVGAYVVTQIIVQLVAMMLRKPEDKIERWRLEREALRARKNARFV